MNKVRWGVLSTAKIGMEKVTPALQRSQWCDVQAIASRSLESAQAAAGKLGVPKAYGSYEELLADPSIEAIYNPLPNDQHVPLTLAAARAGSGRAPAAASAARAFKKVSRRIGRSLDCMDFGPSHHAPVAERLTAPPHWGKY